jgi:hypothetical protein
MWGWGRDTPPAVPGGAWACAFVDTFANGGSTGKAGYVGTGKLAGWLLARGDALDLIWLRVLGLHLQAGPLNVVRVLARPAFLDRRRIDFAGPKASGSVASVRNSRWHAVNEGPEMVALLRRCPRGRDPRGHVLRRCGRFLCRPGDRDGHRAGRTLSRTAGNILSVPVGAVAQPTNRRSW